MRAEFPLQEFDGIEGSPQVMNLVVQVRPGASSGIAGNAHHVALVDDVPGLDIHFFEVGVIGFKAEIVLNDHAVPAQFGIIGRAHNTVGGGVDIPALGANVHAMVKCLAFGDRMDAVAEVAGNGPAFGGKAAGDAAVQHHLLPHAERSRVHPFGEGFIFPIPGSGGGRGDVFDLRFKLGQALADFRILRLPAAIQLPDGTDALGQRGAITANLQLVAAFNLTQFPIHLLGLLVMARERFVQPGVVMIKADIPVMQIIALLVEQVVVTDGAGGNRNDQQQGQHQVPSDGFFDGVVARPGRIRDGYGEMILHFFSHFRLCFRGCVSGVMKKIEGRGNNNS